MSDILRVQPFDLLLRRILAEYEHSRSIFGIHESLWYTPRAGAPYALADVYGKPLATPIGPSAGPHTQLSQNIIAAWLCGGRFIELKTVQILDELEIPRPCIDMEDEGYNVEWSQELKLEESATEYINAWAVIHVLRRLLGWEDLPFGTIFDMSVGYNLEGIKSPRVRRFMDTIEDASEEIAKIRAILRRDFPQCADIEIPARIANSITLSTMHGCPPDEIERICEYLLTERRLHTIVKMNPTLLGKERVLDILHNSLGFREIHIPDAVFEHDISYDKAVGLIGRLQGVAAGQGLAFGVKLSNTLAMHNHKRVMPGDEMYMSGRALYPVTMNLFAKLAHEFGGDPSTGSGQALRVSYSAGADALNIATIASCGAVPITACSDLLKPGGYARFGQWLTNLETAMIAAGAQSLAEFSANKLDNLKAAAAEALTNPRYKKEYWPYGLPKVKSGLGLWDCITAPCMEPCAVCQDVPEYNWWIKEGDPDKALEVILARNPLPGVTGYVCNHLCQTRCVRNDYEESVAIRVLKRYAEENGTATPLVAKAKIGKKVAVIGSGPSGWSAAFYLALNGVDVTIFEAKDVIGGMMRLVPVFRLPWETIQRDVDRILALGVELKQKTPITGAPEKLLAQGFDAVYVATGFQRDAPLRIPGVEGPGVYAALGLLDRTRRGERPDLGKKALVIGGGDTAMDAVRTSQRLTGAPTTIVYRRTRAEMPASPEELEGALEEGNILLELTTPVRVVRDAAGTVVALECLRNRLGDPGPDGRRKPVALPGSEFQIPCDTVIVAVGQNPDFGFLDGSVVTVCSDGGIAIDHATASTGVPGVYAGGDAAEAGPESIIAACGDGRRAAESICWQFGVPFDQPPAEKPRLSSQQILEVKRVRATKTPQVKTQMLPITLRDSFDLIDLSFTKEQAEAEAARCVQCTTFCDKCVEVCPNRANQTFLMQPVDVMLPRLALRGDALAVVGYERFVIGQERQIININDFCNACGDCTTFCVHRGQPWLDKPRLFLNEKDFLAEDHNAYRISAKPPFGTGGVIRHRDQGRATSLARENGHLVYECPEARVTLTPAFEVKEMAAKGAFAGSLSLRDAAEMAVILKGVTETLPQLTL
jgi:putative selenate reductase